MTSLPNCHTTLKIIVKKSRYYQSNFVFFLEFFIEMAMIK